MQWQLGKRAAALALGLVVTVSWRVHEGDPVRRSIRGEGTIELRGSVAYEGTPPAAKPIDMSADPYCAGEHVGDSPVVAPILVDADGRLSNAIVYVKQGLPAGKHAVPADPLLLDQRGCIYYPPVVALRAGQTLVIRNSDATLHNVHVTARENRGFNIGQPIRGIEAKRTFDKPEIGITAACDIHGWMRSVFAVFDHPYFAVTAEDGSFSIPGLPAGDYVLEVWHATLGTQTQRVSVASGAPTTANFSYPPQ